MFFDFSCTCLNKCHGVQMWDLLRPIGLAPRHGERGRELEPWPWLLQELTRSETVARNLEGLLEGVPDYQGVEEVPIAASDPHSGGGTQGAPPFEAGGTSSCVLQRA